ncbi:MAG: GNAT family N-acetyltransferase, partial [Acidovorax sp.]
MFATKDWLKASWDAGRGMLRPVTGRPHESEGSMSAPLMVPIRSLGPSYRERITAHLLQLEPADRYLRFGYAANDEQIRRYADQLDFNRDEIFGIYNRRLELIAMAHLAFSEHPEYEHCAEFGVTGLKLPRGRGYVARLIDRAVMQARNEGVNM